MEQENKRKDYSRSSCRGVGRLYKVMLDYNGRGMQVLYRYSTTSCGDGLSVLVKLVAFLTANRWWYHGKNPNFPRYNLTMMPVVGQESFVPYTQGFSSKPHRGSLLLFPSSRKISFDANTTQMICVKTKIFFTYVYHNQKLHSICFLSLGSKSEGKIVE